MKIAIGNDHRGYKAKQRMIHILTQDGHEVLDCGCESEESADYPDYAKKVAKKVSEEEADRGILICGTGIGMSIAANKVHGERAAWVDDVNDAASAREHNNANIVCVRGGMDGWDMEEIISVFLDCEFQENEERHKRRVKKISEIEKEQSLD